MNILLAATGSVAAIKYWRLFTELLKIGNVKGILTEKGSFFADISYSPEIISKINMNNIYTEDHEWKWKKIGDSVIHIDLKEWADILVIAPLTANTLTKIAVGICDNLLTSVCYAWNTNKPIIVAPAMNTDMWNNPLTKKHLDEISQHYCKVEKIKQVESIIVNSYIEMLQIIEPIESKLACGVIGKGAMAPLSEIVNTVKKYNKEIL